MSKDNPQDSETKYYDTVYVAESFTDKQLEDLLTGYFKLDASELLVSAPDVWLNRNLFSIKVVCEVMRLDADFKTRLHFIQLNKDRDKLPAEFEQITELQDLFECHIMVRNITSINRYIWRLVRSKDDNERVHVSPARLDKYSQAVIDEYLGD